MNAAVEDDHDFGCISGFARIVLALSDFTFDLLVRKGWMRDACKFSEGNARLPAFTTSWKAAKGFPEALASASFGSAATISDTRIAKNYHHFDDC